MADWRDNLINDARGIADLLHQTRTIAVLGIKPESHASQPAFYVPAHMAAAGYEIIPVPVYFPEATEILGKPVFRTLGSIGRPIEPRSPRTSTTSWPRNPRASGSNSASATTKPPNASPRRGSRWCRTAV